MNEKFSKGIGFVEKTLQMRNPVIHIKISIRGREEISQNK